MTHTQACLAKIALAIAAVGLVAWRLRERTRRPSKLLWSALCVAALSGQLVYQAEPRLGFVGYWDLYHYYLGSKYFEELGYCELYAATIAADRDDAGMFTDIDRVRDICTQGYVSAESLLRDRAVHTRGFTPARWDEFRRDVAWFQARIARDLWPAILTDRGYHASPAWDRLAGWFARALPLTTPGAVYLLILPDNILWCVACAAICWGYGGFTLGLFLVAWGANPLHMTPLKGAFLRLDWLVALVVACAAYRRKRDGIAGASLAYAAAMRVFPVVFAGGWLVRAAWRATERRTVSRRDIRFGAAFGAVLVALFALGSPLDRWSRFADKISLHSRVVSVQRSGLEYLVGLDRPVLYWASAISLAAAFVLAVRRMPRSQLLPAGFVLMFAFVSAASYYYSVIAILVLLWHRRAGSVDLRNVSAIMGAFVIGAIAAIVQGGAISGEISFLWSLLLLGLSIGTLLPARS